MTTTRQRRFASLVSLIVFMFLALGSFDNNDSRRSSEDGPKSEALQAVKLDYQLHKAGFDNVLEADFTITNPTSYTIKDFEITCISSAASGTQIDRNTSTIYEVVGPKGKKVIRHFNMGFLHSQAKSSKCKITNMVVQP